MKKLGDGPDVFATNCMIDFYSDAGMVSEAESIFNDLKQVDQANEFSYAMMMCLYK